MKKEQLLVQEIHSAFDTAQDLLLEQAKEITNANVVSNADHVAKMKELGFVNSNVVKEAEEKHGVIVENRETADLIMYYKQTYPFLKFLTETKLDEICDKYALIHAPVRNYKKDVPDKNLKEILNIQALGREDRAMNTCRVKKAEYFSEVSGKIKRWISSQEFEFTRGTPPSDREIMEMCPIRFRGSWLFYSGFPIWDITKKEGNYIAAPKSHFDLKGTTKKGKKGFFKTEIFKPEVKDPIVFRYVRGGIQVLSKWGLEANDPDLANALDN